MPRTIEGLAGHAGGAIGGGLVGIAIGAVLDPFLAAHHWPIVSQAITDALIGLGGGVGSDIFASQTHAARISMEQRRKTAELRRQIDGLAKQIATIFAVEDKTRLRDLLSRRVADWDTGAIETATFEVTLKSIRSDYLNVTGSGPKKRTRK